MVKTQDFGHKFRGTHPVTIKVPKQRVHDALTGTIESSNGSRYWANIDVGEHSLGWANYFTAKFTTIDTGSTFRLTQKKLDHGLNILARKYFHIFADIMSESGDAMTGDALVQCALFGDIIYG